jgi:hypothetical protein
MLGLGLGISAVLIPAQAASMATIDQAQIGRASLVFNPGKQFGGAIGVALLTTVLATAGPGPGAGAGRVGLAGFHDGFLAAAAVAVIAVAVAWTIHDADAAATMVPRRRQETAAQPKGRPPPEDSVSRGQRGSR